MGATDLGGYVHAAKQQDIAQAQMQAALQAAIRAPHTIHCLATVAVGVRQEGAQTVLMVGTPDGQRYDIPLAHSVLVSLGKSVESQGEMVA